MVIWDLIKPFLDTAKTPPRSRLIRDLTTRLLIRFISALVHSSRSRLIISANQNRARLSIHFPIGRNSKCATPFSAARVSFSLPPCTKRIRARTRHAARAHTKSLQSDICLGEKKSSSRITPRVRPRLTDGVCTSVEYIRKF